MMGYAALHPSYVLRAAGTAFFTAQAQARCRGATHHAAWVARVVNRLMAHAFVSALSVGRHRRRAYPRACLRQITYQGKIIICAVA